MDRDQLNDMAATVLKHHEDTRLAMGVAETAIAWALTRSTQPLQLPTQYAWVKFLEALKAFHEHRS